jgi:hypothetical protein
MLSIDDMSANEDAISNPKKARGLELCPADSMINRIFMGFTDIFEIKSVKGYHVIPVDGRNQKKVLASASWITE